MKELRAYLTVKDKEYIRSGYYKTHHDYLSEDMLKEMSQQRREEFYLVGEKEVQRKRNAWMFWIIAVSAVIVLFSAIRVHNNHLEAAAEAAAATDGCYTPKQANIHIGLDGCVEYHVSYVFETDAGTKFLDERQNYGTGFVGYIPYNSQAQQDINLSNYLNRNIRVSGTIKTYNGYTEIEIDNSNQVSTL